MSLSNSPAEIRRLVERHGITPTFLADGTGVLLDVDGHQVLSLNRSASFLVEAILAGDTDQDSLKGRFAAEFGLTGQQAEDDILAFLTVLHEKISARRAPTKAS